MVDSLLGNKTGNRRGSGGGPRLVRTILLGTVAVAFAVYWLAQSYGVDLDELLGYLRTSLLFVGFFALVGLAGGCLLWLLRRLRQR